MMPPELMRLMRRFNQLGQLLPRGDSIARAIIWEDAAKRAECILVLDEMDRVGAQIDALIAAARAEADKGKA
jgi:ATP-dependent Zn protease